jgi:superfamily II DNA or RNA helicase
MSLASEFSSDFPGIIRSRGADYFREKKVKIDHGCNWDVKATVRGEQRYDVILMRKESSVYISCTCPYFDSDGPCKHLWAVILEIDEKGYLGGDGAKTPLSLVEASFDDDEEFEDDELEDDEFDDDDEDDLFDDDLEDGVGRSGLSRYMTGNGQLHSRNNGPVHWKDPLAGLSRSNSNSYTGKRDHWPPSRRLIYVIDIPATLGSQYLILDTLIQDRKQDGDWSKPRKHRIPRWQISEFPEVQDRHIFAMLAGSREQIEFNYYGYSQDAYDTVPFRYRLSAPLPALLLPAIGQTGRCFLRMTEGSDDLKPVVWDGGEPWRFSVDMRQDLTSAGNYQLVGLLRRGEEQLNFAEPLLMLEGGLVFTHEKVARLDDGGAFNFIAILRRAGALVVPEKQVGEFLTTVLSDPLPPPMELPAEFQYETVAAQPKACLIIKSQARSGRLHARVSFDYSPGSKDAIVDSDDQRKGIFDSQSRRFLLRDRSAEFRATQRMAEFGLKFLPPNPQNQSSGWDIAPTKLPRIVRSLIAEGWHVEAEGKTFRNPGDIKINVSSGIDWFELHGVIDFGGAQASLPTLLAAVKRGDTMVKLDDGTYGMLPEEWLNKYGLLAGLGETHDDHLRFRKTQVGVLDALLSAQSDANFDAVFDQAREKMRQFEGVKTAEAPGSFQGELRPYQKDGLGWIHFLRDFSFGGCLADDMGLGKTIQVLALLESRRLAHSTNGSNGSRPAPSLAVVPKSLVFNWKLEAARFTPQLRILDHTGQFREKETVEHFEEYDLIITTYGTLRNDAILFKDLQFDYIILDEAQAIKNADTASAKAARLLRGDHRLALSGTPVENHLGELWSMFEFLNPGMLGAASVFKLTGAGARNPDEETRKLLSTALRPFILRRTKEQVAKDLPEKVEQTIFCELEPKQRKLYNELRDHYRNSLLHRIETEGLAKSKMHVLEALLRLRQAACHPGLIDKARIKEASAKIDFLMPQLSELFQEGHKVLVFSQFTSLLAILRAGLDEEKIPYEYLDGKTRDRQARVEKFQNDPETKLFLISLKAGGLGLNLTAAEYVYLLDPWWNPAVEAQAIDRAHRIGQTRRVFAYRIIARDTVEEKVLALQNTKRDLADAIINADNSLIRSLAKEDLELLLS